MNYLKIENPGLAAPESFTLLGATTKTNNSNNIGKFGSGNKFAILSLLRKSRTENTRPIVFTGNLKMEFYTRKQQVESNQFERVQVKYAGKDHNGKSKNNIEDLGFVVDYGSHDWKNTADLALREFVSNAIDKANEVGELNFLAKYLQKHGEQDAKTNLQDLIKVYRQNANVAEQVTIEVVEESQVRAKANTTRVFVPLTDEVNEFYHNLGKWFLHFSEPNSLKQTILKKSHRNLTTSHNAVIYHHGVRVREFQASSMPSLFDYNINDLKIDESRQVDDWTILYAAGKSLANANQEILEILWNSFQQQDTTYWEHSFGEYSITDNIYNDVQRKAWQQAFDNAVNPKTIVSTRNGGDRAKLKGYNVLIVPEAFVKVAERSNIPTPDKVLTQDEKDGRQIAEPNQPAIIALQFAWNTLQKLNLTNNKEIPKLKLFSTTDEDTPAFYRDETVFINQKLTENQTALSWIGLDQELIKYALKMTAQHATTEQNNITEFAINDLLLNAVIEQAKLNFLM